MKLNLGGGTQQLLGWINLDLRRGHDLRRGLPDWQDASVEAVYSCHFLEHVTHAEGERLLGEVYRVLKPGGVVRIGVPDFELFARAYVEDDEAFAEQYFARYLGGLEPDPASVEDPQLLRSYGPLGALIAIVHGWGHRAIYDERALRGALGRAGFPAASIRRCAFGQSHYYGHCELDRSFEDHTVFVEAEKPGSAA
jgi:SAM-dependent methyltransferase